MRDDDRPDEARCDVCGRRAGHARGCDFAEFDEPPMVARDTYQVPSTPTVGPQTSGVKGAE